MNLATWSIRNPIPSILLFILLTIAGLRGFNQLGVQDLPDLDLPTVKVDLRLSGMAPSQLETEVARKVEDSMAKLQGLKHLSTHITEGNVSITATFRLERDLSDALADAKDAIDRIRNDLPADLEEPKVSKVTVGPGGPFVTYALKDDRMDEEALSWFIDDSVAKAVLSVPDVGDFARVGGVQREVRVTIDRARLATFGATALDVSRALKLIEQDASGGRVRIGGAELGVRTIATVSTAADLNQLRVLLPDGRSVRLGDIATIEDGIADRTQAATLDGRMAAGFQIWRTKGFDETRIAAHVEQALERLEAQHPGLTFQLVSSTVEHTQEQYEGSMHMLYEGAMLAVLVILLFLRNWRATIIGAAALPLSIIPAFAYMARADYTLNTITLLALAVVVGILVDDAIVEVENVIRHVRDGKTAREATAEAVNEIALAVLATTSTLVVVFLPTAFMGGVPGLVFKQFGWTIVVAVLLSLMVARIMTPLMAVWLIKPGHQHDDSEGRLLHGYLNIAKWCLNHRGAAVAAGGLIVAASVAIFPLLPTGFIPPGDRGYTTISLELPSGSSLAQTMAVAEEARRAVTGTRGVKSIFVSAGDPANPEAGEVRRASLVTTFAPRGERPKQREIESTIRERLQRVPGARFSLGGGGSGEKIELILSGSDNSALAATARKVEHDLHALGYLNGITSTANLERQEVVFRPDADRAAERGVTTSAIGQTVRVALSGDRSSALAKLNLDNRQVNIRVAQPALDRYDLSAIASLQVHGKQGLVPLESVADVAIGSSLSEINRYDRERQVTLTGDLSGHALGDALKDAQNLPSIKAMPASVHLEESGDAETQAELFAGMKGAMGLGVLLVYAVLVLLFKSWFQPITILSAVPLSVGGAFIALLLTHGELNLPSLIGLVMLMGIVTKNSILVVDFTIVGINRGLSRHEALIDACRKRAQPIMMTTTAMICGMAPLALGFGADASFRQPMAITVIGGLLTSTAMSLLMVPVIFTYIGDFEAWLTRDRVRKEDLHI
ncbi:efflux RND transporter permease subunit [Mariprofundus erugo]|uniref:Efflux RND transporter permease subunit n=1 Tax=Mariprofundus erugo TaxID=2528639 RepID=A0A5R9GK77_9PROT|nr:efflux RND transporter permease subunit [Mariprofundus erugo]TLS65469.1 efflux RND transporter permease subunit [Mariprofundus erugo]